MTIPDVQAAGPPLGHVRLFRKEILESGLLTTAFVDRECAFLETRFVEALRELFKKQPERALKHLVQKIIQSHPERSDVFLRVLTESCREETDVLDELFLTHLKKASREKYLSLFRNDPLQGVTDQASLVLKAAPFLEILKTRYPNMYPDLVKKVEALLRHGYHDAAACKILRAMPLAATSDEDLLWWFHLLDVCDRDPSNRVILKLLDENFRQTIEEFREEQKSKAVSAKRSDDLKVFDDSIADRERQFRPQSAFLDEREEVDLDLLPDAEEIELRDYQEELVQAASRGNTIVCAPTGSGKTIVAAKLVLDHFTKRRQGQEGDGKRAVMFVPTIPLVDQQATSFLRFMRKKHYVFGASGAERIASLGKKILASDVVVITPELFYNYLVDPRASERIFVSDFSLFLFDECHHCASGHPYRKIMRMVTNFEGARPHIVGFTASVGVGSGGTTPNECIDHMATICANLSATSITTVRRCVESLKEAVSSPEDKIISVHRGDSRIRRMLVETVKCFEAHAAKRLSQVTLPGHREKGNAFPDISKIAAYFGFLNRLASEVKEDKRQSVAEKNAFLETIQRVKMFYKMLNLADLLPAKFAYSILRDFSFKDVDGLEREQKKWLTQLEHLLASGPAAEEDLQKPVLSSMKEVLVEQYSKEPESRTLIFVNTRDLAALLCAHLNEQWEDFGLRRPRCTDPVGFLTSSNQAASAGGLTAERQREALDYFRSGEHKVLVATSVADEGLDVATCNLIIKYNSSGGSELTLIQRRGRARAQGSKSVLLALDGAIEKAELESKKRERMMHATLEHLHATPGGAVRRMIEDKAEQLRKEEEREREKMERERLELPEHPFVVACVKCSTQLTSSEFLRRVGKAHVAACDPGIWKRLRIVANEKVAKEGAQQSLEVSKLVCAFGDCASEVATLGRDGHVFLPFLRSQEVSLQEQNEFQRATRDEGRALRSWKKLDFFVPEVDDHDRKAMFLAFEDIDPAMTKEVRQHEERRTQKRARRAVVEQKEREMVHRAMQLLRQDPNAEDDDYGYSTSASATVTKEDFPFPAAPESRGRPLQAWEEDFYREIEDSECGFDGYESA